MRVIFFFLILAPAVIGGLIGWRMAVREMGGDTDFGLTMLSVTLGAAIGFGVTMVLGLVWELAGML